MNKYSKLLTKTYLIKEYIQNKISVRIIAEEIGCNRFTVLNYLKRFKIKIRTTYLHDLDCHCASCKSIKGEFTGIQNPNFKDGRKSAKHYCIENCGREISYNAWLYGSKLCAFCCRKKERSPTYIDGRSYEPYVSNFNIHLKESIRTRDNFECQNCGMTEEEHLTVWGTVLNIHHIDYNKKNCEEINLITTCLICNIKANSNRDYWKNFYNIKIKEIIGCLKG